MALIHPQATRAVFYRPDVDDMILWRRAVKARGLPARPNRMQRRHKARLAKTSAYALRCGLER